jgi:hypothetical protein
VKDLISVGLHFRVGLNVEQLVLRRVSVPNVVAPTSRTTILAYRSWENDRGLESGIRSLHRAAHYGWAVFCYWRRAARAVQCYLSL